MTGNTNALPVPIKTWMDVHDRKEALVELEQRTKALEQSNNELE